MSGATIQAADGAALSELVDAMRERQLGGERLLLVLGSGLGALAERLVEPIAVDYGELPGLPVSRVPGHTGRFVSGSLGGERVLVQQGRVHLYEGWDALEVTRAVRAFAALGGQACLLTNAAGGLDPDWPPGTLMRVVDHVDLQNRQLVMRGSVQGGSPYDVELGERIDEVASELGQRLERGVYAGGLGPAYETPAEVRMLRDLVGADACGMSTVAEAKAARAGGLRVAAISCITNLAAGLSGQPLSHDEVVETGKRVADEFCALIEAAAPRLANAL